MPKENAFRKLLSSAGKIVSPVVAGFAPIRIFFERIIRTGTAGIQDEETVNRIRSTNTLSLSIGIAIIAIAPLVYYFIPKVSLLIPIIIELLINFSVILFNKYRHYLAAGLILYFLQCAAIIYFCFLLGGIIQLQSMVIFLLSIICLLFKDRHIRVLALVGAVGTFAVLQTGYYYNIVTPIQVSYHDGYVIQTAAMIGVIIMLIIIAKPFIKSNDTNHVLKKQNRLVKTYVAEISHEMRSPLNAIGLISKLLKKQIKKEQKEQQLNPFVDMLIVASGKTRSLVNNVLNMAQVEAGVVEANVEQTFFVRPFFAKLIDVSKIIAQSRKMKIRLLIDQMPSLITSDPLKLSQILDNLLGNAIKYGKKNGIISVTIGRQEDHTWTIEVENQADPIPTDKLQTLFDPFATSKPDQITEGTGLGLWIVRNKVTSMNGTVNIEYTPDEYIVFKISLPLQVGKSKDIEPDDETDDELMDVSGARILIGEDEAINARALSLHLQALQCHVDIANNGRDLLNRARNHPPDLIIMDYHMPLMNGLIAIQHLKSDPKLKLIPVLVTTGDIFTDTLDKVLEAGADDILTKPVESSPLHRMLSKHLNLKRANVQNEK